MRKLGTTIGWASLVFAVAAAGLLGGQGLLAPAREVGRYESPSEDEFDGRTRQSLYVTSRDGTELAVDVYHPTREGKAAKHPLPSLLTMTRYHRAHQLGAATVTPVERRSGLRLLLSNGLPIFRSRGPKPHSMFIDDPELPFERLSLEQGYDP